MNKQYINNRIKRILPSSLSAMIKELQMLSYSPVRMIEPSVLYNEHGEQMKNYYLRDACFRFEYSATIGRYPRYINWDKYRSNIKYHFYTDDMLFTEVGKPIKKYGIVFEPETLQPRKYKTLLKNADKMSEYEVIFTSSERLLDRLANAKPLIYGGVYVGTIFGGGTNNLEDYLYKDKNISLVASNKRLCPLHELRYQLAKKYENNPLVDCFGNFSGKENIKIIDSLQRYRYSIVIENSIEPYWITERICNCLATMTVPIYLGSPLIGNFFNKDGIIQLTMNELGKIDEIIHSCNEKDYLSRKEALLDNFERVKRYYCMEDWLFEHYKDILP